MLAVLYNDDIIILMEKNNGNKAFLRVEDLPLSGIAMLSAWHLTCNRCCMAILKVINGCNYSTQSDGLFSINDLK